MLKQPCLEKHDPTIVPQTNLSQTCQKIPTALPGAAGHGGSVAKTSGAGAQRGTGTSAGLGEGLRAHLLPRGSPGGLSGPGSGLSPRYHTLPRCAWCTTACCHQPANAMAGERGRQTRCEDGGQRAPGQGGFEGRAPARWEKALLASAAGSGCPRRVLVPAGTEAAGRRSGKSSRVPGPVRRSSGILCRADRAFFSKRRCWVERT